MTIVSGIQPSGRLHVGNYLGAVVNWLALQAEARNRCFFFLADWHSLTETYEAKEKAAQVRELAIELLACGIEPTRVVLFRQSDILEHMELAWYFACVTPVAEMERMTQYKDKTARGYSPNTGLFTYPVLMAADILAYANEHGGAETPQRQNALGETKPADARAAGVAVPVGHDQLQHIELTNEIVRWFNNQYGATFPAAKPILTETARVMSLKDSARKMSKSLGGDHCLFLDDAPEEVERKLRSAVTATTGGDGMAPGVATLFAILEACGDAETLMRFRAAHDAGTIQYSDLKPAVARAFSAHFAEFRQRKAALLADPATVDRTLADGAERARAVAQQTLARVRRAVGVR